jgi:hypothetical protein
MSLGAALIGPVNGVSSHDARMLQYRTALASAFIILFAPLTLPLALWRILPFGDLSSFHVPMRFLYRQALRSGDSMLWSSALGSGLYLHAEGQSGMAHPFHLLIYRALPLTAAINIEMLASYLFALAGMFLLLRHFSITREAAFAGALAFAFSGFQLVHLNHLNVVAVAAHMPWVLHAGDVLMTDSDPRRRAIAFAGVALLFGSQLLLGFPQGVWVSGLAFGWLVIFRAATGTPLPRAALACAAVFPGILIGGAQLLPTLDAVRTSFRAATTFDFRLTFSLHPLNLVQLFSPYAFSQRVYTPWADEWFVHEFGLYNGAIATQSLFWIAMRWRSLRHRRLATGMLCLAAIGLILALGRYGGVYPFLAQLPGLASLRAPARHIALVHFALAVLSAIALEDAFALASAGRPLPFRRLWPLAVAPAVGVALAALAVAATGSAWATSIHLRGRHMMPALAGVAVIAATGMILAACARGRRRAAPLLVVLIAVDLACWGTRYAYSEAPVPIRAVMPAGGFPPAGAQGDLVHPQVVLTEMNKYPLRGFRSSLAYLGLTQSSILDPASAAGQRVAGVRWNWTAHGWLALDDTLPRARLVADRRVSSDPAADLATIDPAKTALVDVRTDPISGVAGTSTIVRDDAGRIMIQTNAPAPQLLVLAERFHEGWRGDADGVPVHIVRAYGDFMGMVVPAGAHSVRLAFAPASFRYGLWATFAGLLLLLGAAIGIAFSEDRGRRSTGRHLLRAGSPGE